LLAEIAGTIGGFGSSVFFVPLATWFYGFQAVLMLTALLHDFSNTSKLFFFRKHVNYKLLVHFGIPSTVLVIAGAWLSRYLHTSLHEVLLGIFLAGFSAWMYFRPAFVVAPTRRNSQAGGAAAGFLAGLIGTGGALRGLSLAAFALEKNAFIATSAAIDFFVDLARTGIYYHQGYLSGMPLDVIPWLVVIAISGTWIGKRLLEKIPQSAFRGLVLGMLFLTGVLMLWKAIGQG
jgi:uncharacterized membrane protein YfcA